MVAELAGIACAFPDWPQRAKRLVEAYGATLDAAPLDEGTRKALRQFFLHSSAYVVGKEAAEPEHEELAARWREQRNLDDAIGAIAVGRDHEALALAPQFASHPSVFVGLLGRMVQSGRAGLIRYVTNALESEPALATRCFSGRTLLHFASGAGCVDVVAVLLRLGTDPNMQDRGGHTPLYCVANECDRNRPRGSSDAGTRRCGR